MNSALLLIALCTWTCLGLVLLFKLILKSNPTSNMKAKPNNNTAQDKLTQNKIGGHKIMQTHTVKGLRKDFSNLVDKAAIRFVNLLDRLKGDYENGKE